MLPIMPKSKLMLPIMPKLKSMARSLQSQSWWPKQTKVKVDGLITPKLKSKSTLPIMPKLMLPIMPKSTLPIMPESNSMAQSHQIWSQWPNHTKVKVNIAIHAEIKVDCFGRVDMYCLQWGMSTIMEGSAPEWILGSWRSWRFNIFGQKGNERKFPTVSFSRKVASSNCNTNRSLF